MKKKRIISFALAVAVLLGCMLCAGCAGDEQDQTPSTAAPKETTPPTDPTPATDPTDPTPATDPTEPDVTEPAAPTDPSDPESPTDPVIPEDPEDPGDDPVTPNDPENPTEPPEEPELPQKAQILVTKADGTPAKGAAVIATGENGWQEYEPTDETGLAVLELPRGGYSVQVFLDGQRLETTLKLEGETVQKSVRLENKRRLYVLFDASGDFDCAPSELLAYAALQDVVRTKYPDAIYLTPENRYDVTFHDGDALLSLSVFVEKYESADKYFASELRVTFTTYQTCITAWDRDDGGEEIEMELADANSCSIRIQNDYDYDYKDTATVITESFYQVQSDWHFSKYSGRTDAWSYGYDMDTVRSTSTEKRIKAAGAGMKIEAFLFDLNETRYQNYADYVEQLFPYADLWMSGNWNEEIEALVAGEN